jgi:hypothetical protein
MPFSARIRDMAHLPFSVFKRAGRRFYSVSFKNEAGAYLPALSTKQETEAEAIQTAFRWLKDGIPRKGEAVPFKNYTLRDMAKGADIDNADAVFILKELQRRGLLKSYVLSETTAAVPFGEYLAEFWDWEKSAYVKEKRRKNHGIHRRYVIGMAGSVKKYWLPLFENKLLGEVSRQDIETFMTTIQSVITYRQKNLTAKAKKAHKGA